MNKKVAPVMKFFIELTESDKVELINNINQYISGDFQTRRMLNEEATKSIAIHFGPSPQTCPYCGR